MFGVGTLNTMAQKSAYGSLQSGDLLFLDLDCELCEAIEDVTTSYQNHRFSHIGLVWVKNDSVFVIEAVSKGVVATPINSFINRSKNELLLGRLRPEYQHLIKESIDFSVNQIGKSYDDEFIYDNGKYYCSELIYDAFFSANNKQPFFELQPMTYKEVGTGKFSLVWQEYFSKIKKEIPEGKAGINPGGISRSKKLVMYKLER